MKRIALLICGVLLLGPGLWAQAADSGAGQAVPPPAAPRRQGQARRQPAPAVQQPARDRRLR